MEMHMLHAADLKAHGHATMADIFAEMSNWGVHSSRAGIRYSDRHMKTNSTNVVDQRDCRILCEQDAECKGWSFANEGGFCELVTSIASSEEDWRFTGGISQPAYVCQSAIS